MQLSPHLVRQAGEKHISIESIREVLAHPETTYGSFTRVNGQRVERTCPKHGVAQRKFVGTASDGTRLCIPVNTCCKVAITVFLDQVETPLRPDQIAKGVRR